MRTYTTIACAVIFSCAHALMGAEQEIAQLPNGVRYLKHELNFELHEEYASGLSPAGSRRRAVDKGRLRALHNHINEVTGGSLSSRSWLDGRELPARRRLANDRIPRVARTLKARLRDGQDASAVVEQLEDHPNVKWACVIPVHRTSGAPDDPAWNGTVTDQWGPKRMGMEAAWDVPAVTSSVRIAIIDTGVDLDHPDLASRIVYNAGFAGNPDGDAPADGRKAADHGTHVAGIAAAVSNDDTGIAGVANARLMAMGCSNWSDEDGKYLITSVADAINDAVDNGADVINCSFGSRNMSRAERNALDDARSAGVLVVVSAGNGIDNGSYYEGVPVADDPDNRGWLEHDWPLLVSNVTRVQNSDGSWTDGKVTSSNFGSAIDIGAPGSDIISTIPTWMRGEDWDGNTAGGYDVLGGTSMAAPHVAGAAAVLRSMNPSLSATTLKDILYRMADDIGDPGRDDLFGHGMLQIHPSFLQLVKEADTFAGVSSQPVTSGSYALPYTTLPEAVAAAPPRGILVLNGGIGGRSDDYQYDAITINSAVTLKAFPDRPVLIGNP